MQAIVTRFLPATNNKPSRFKAWCERGSIVLSTGRADNDSLNTVEALCAKFAQEDLKQYGTPVADNPWMRPKIEAGLPNGVKGHNVYVFTS